MDRELTISPLLINHQPIPNPTSWVKIFIYEPAEADILALRGKMYAVLSVSSKVQVDFTPVMQLILEELHNKYFQETAGGILQVLETTLDQIHSKLLLMAQQDKRLGAGFDFNLLTAVSWGTVLYFGQLGASRAALLRNGMLYDIDEGDSKSTSLYLSSGILQPQDRLILGTNELFHQIGKEQLQTTLGSEPTLLAKALEDQLAKQAPRAMQSAIVLLVDIKQVPSYQDEAIQIKDADQPFGQPMITVVGRPKSPLTNLTAGIDLLKRKSTQLLHWHIFGRVPGLPIVIGLIAAVILATSIGWGLTHKQPTSVKVDLQPLISQLTTQLAQAKQLAAINPDRAQDIVAQMDQNFAIGLAAQATNRQLIDLKQQRDQLEDQLHSSTPLQNSKKIAQLEIVYTQAKLTIIDQQIYALDKQKNQLLAVTELGKISSVSTNKQFNQALLSSSDAGLVMVSNAKAYAVSLNGVLGPAIALPGSPQPKSLTGFRQTTYLLDGVGQVLRIPANAAENNPPTTYFRQPIDGSSLVDVAVDGSVFLLRQDGAVEQYLNSDKQTFSLERASLAAKSVAIMTSENTDKLYLMQARAIAVWNKNGKYVGQYYLPDRPTWQMAGIDFRAKTLYILSNGKLFKSDLP